MPSRIEKLNLMNGTALREIEDFCCEAGIPRFAPIKGDILAVFAMRDPEDEIEATARLEINLGHPFIETVAVREDLRGRGLGKKIVNAVLEEARKRDIKAIWAMARAPGFFKKMGFERESDGEFLAELIKGCEKCPDYLKVCNPELLRKIIID